MSIQDAPQSFHNPEAAVFRPGEFYGREGLVRNLLWRLERRESLSIFGGPKLGKTSLLLHLAWQLNHSSSVSRSNSPQAVYVDMSIEKDRRQFIETRANGELVMLLDNCDYVLADDHNVLALSSMVSGVRSCMQEAETGWNLLRAVDSVDSNVSLGLFRCPSFWRKKPSKFWAQASRVNIGL